MKKIITLLIFSCLLSCNKSLYSNKSTQRSSIEQSKLSGNLDITSELVKNNNDSASHNTSVFVKAVSAINSKTDFSTIYIGKGFFYFNELPKDIDLRFVNLQGAGKRHTIIALANNRNTPFIDTKMYFESHIRDIQFNGNKDHNPHLESILKFSSGNCYTVEFDNVYFRNYSHIGLQLIGGQNYTLNNTDAKYGGVGGIYIKDALNVEINQPDIEQNKGFAILCESSFETGKYRYEQPLIEINNPYCESNGVGILLKGISRVRVNGGYNYNGIFAKVTSNDNKSSYSHYNYFDGNHIGKIIIEKGNYGNHINPGRTSVIDKDGRNTNFLKGVSENYKSSKLLKPYTSVTNTAKVHDQGITFTSHTNNKSAWVYLYPESDDKFLYLKLKGDLNTKVGLRIYDLSLKQYFNFSTSEFQNNHRDYNVIFKYFPNGETEYLKLPIDLFKSIKPRVQLLFSSKTEDLSRCELYGFNFSKQ